ncbi:MAG: TonB-dependent receptor [Candidatus Desulfofervidus sp.]|nr:TonB-dependent receptor [Candidatus Desulfofervidus sp.]
MKKLLWLLMFVLFMPSFAFSQLKEEKSGIISGVVLDKNTGETLIEAGVEVVETGKKVFTDLDGKFRLELPEGKYEIRVFYPLYQGQRIKNVVVRPGKVTRLDISLEPRKEEKIEVVEVVAEPERATEATQLILRKKAPAITDRVSSEVIKKQPDADVAEVVRRVTGISVVKKKYVFVRGLGDRYSKTTLDKACLASPEPEKKIVPLDLFPATIVESINVAKSYTPDLPAEFSGGLVQIETKDYPDTFKMKFSLSTGYNSRTTFKAFKQYNGGNWDWLGFDDGTRDIPDEIPSEFIKPLDITGEGFSPEEIVKFGRAFENIWNPSEITAYPSQGFGFEIGNKVKKFGYFLNLHYGRKFQTIEDEERKWYSMGYQGRQKILADFTFNTYEKKVDWGGILNVGFELSPQHKFSFKNFYQRKSNDQVREYFGYHETWGQDIWDRRLKWQEEYIYQGQLLGNHHISFGKSDINWRVSYSKTGLEEPDQREVQYFYDREAGEPTLWMDSPRSGTRYFADLGEYRWDTGLDWKLDLENLIKIPTKLKWGFSYTYQDRDFTYRRFHIRRGPGILDVDLSLDPQSLYAPENFKVRNGWWLEETTRSTDAYDAWERNVATYAMLDLLLFDKLRTVGGIRFEADDIEVATFNPFDPQEAVVAKLSDDDIFPAINVTFSLTDTMNLRGSYSETVNRPQLRELSEFEYYDVAETETVVGNPDLKTANFKNFDIRWEWFPSVYELQAVSFFYKDITKPIERVQEATSAGTRRYYINAKSGYATGLELEIRKGLGFIHPLFTNLTTNFNYTYTYSKVEMGSDITPIMTAAKRPLHGQSDHIINLVFDYTNPDRNLTIRLLYNYIGKRLYAAAAYGLPDIYEEPTHWLDFLVKKNFGPWELKFTAKNLLNEQVEFTQGDKIYQRYKEGVSFSIGLSRYF